MTALVGILNKHAAALAADSAVTVSNSHGTKIYNTSRKIFHISSKNPVGFMTYENAEFMETPWDVIVSLYIEERGDRTFKTINGYCEDFLDFLIQCGFFSTEENQKKYFMRELRELYTKVTDTADSRVENELSQMENPSDDVIIEAKNRHLQEVLKDAAEIYEQNDKGSNFGEYSYGRFMRFIDDYWREFEKNYLNEPMADDFREALQQLMYKYITSNLFYFYSGIVFIGYGSSDIYPASAEYVVSGIFDGRLRYMRMDIDAISNDSNAFILPYAQTDVMHTMMKGIAPAFRETISKWHRTSLLNLKETICNALMEAGVSEEAIAKINEMEVDDIQKEYEDAISTYISDNHVDGILDAVASFNIQDMSNMAESLISITNLHRHFSSSEESVGGPVEVAVITRGGGFQWVKHQLA